MPAGTHHCNNQKTSPQKFPNASKEVVPFPLRITDSTDEEINNSPTYLIQQSTQSCKAQRYNLNSSLYFERIFNPFGWRGEVKEDVDLESNSPGSNLNFAFSLVTTWPWASYSSIWNLMTLINKNETVVKITTLLPTSEDGQENQNQHVTWFCHLVGC